jgi:Mrp family chromosome partitioning ATPase/predicted Fe-Mo cluster-binding NifX family protein
MAERITDAEQPERKGDPAGMNRIKNKIVVLSGKGGVGKSTIAVNLAVWLSLRDKKVGLLDIDIHGPSIPKLLNLDANSIFPGHDKIGPALYNRNLKVMSIGLLMPSDEQAVIWRGPMKHNLIKQFIGQVDWGDLDYLVVDCPPGTGDEPLSIVQLLKQSSQDEKTDAAKTCSALVVTTAQQLAVIDVKKCITFCSQLELSVLGIIENMSEFVCPHCGGKTKIFTGDGGKDLAGQFNIAFLGSVPMDTHLMQACEQGKPFVEPDEKSAAASALNEAFEKILSRYKQTKTDTSIDKKQLNKVPKEVKDKMRIAIPITNGVLSSHFGHCEKFAIIETDDGSNQIINRQDFSPPPHEPGVLPKWLGGMGVNVIIAGGMGRRAQQLFTQNQIKVVTGASVDEPENLVSAYLNKTLTTGENICDH